MYENENQSFDNREQDYHYTNTPEQQAPTRPRKKNTNAARIAKKAGAIALSAVLFGGVASGTFLGVNYAAGYRNNASTAASSESASASSQTASSSSSLLKATTPVSTGSAASSGSLDVSSVAESVMPSIVSITNKSVQEVQNYFSMFGYGGQAQEVESTSVGSGIIIGKNDTELLIVTNNHVVEGADTLSASFIDNSVYEATIKGTDSDNDLAVIAVPLSSISDDTMSQIAVAAVGDSDSLKVGEQVVAIGNALGYGQSVTTGIVSATDRTLSSSDSDDSNALISSTVTTKETPTYIQTDAAINPGNSGGALVNTRGELVGINTLIKSQTGTYMGYSFAIPSAIVKKVVVDLKEYGVVQRALLGVSYREIDEEFVEAFGEEYGIRETGGVYVADVSEDGAAKAAGIRKGDVITAIDGIRLGNNTNLAEIMSRYRPNDKVTISVKRDGKTKQFEVVLRNKAGKAELLSRDYVDVAESLGGRFAEINDRTRRELRIENGIRVTEVRPGGVLARARVKEGFVITHINDRPIRSVADLDRVTGPVTYIEGVYPNGRAISYSLVQ